MIETYPGRREEIYDGYLQNIGDIRFTFREIDVMACIYHNRGEKKIGSLLDISHRTVGAHVRNIMGKLGNSSRDYVIDFIEKSGKLNYLKEYYLNLLVEASFHKQLQRISAINRQGMSIVMPKSNKLTEKEVGLIQTIKEFLSKTNIECKGDLLSDTANSNITLSYNDSEIVGSLQNNDLHTIKLILSESNTKDRGGNRDTHKLDKEEQKIDFTAEKEFYKSFMMLACSIVFGGNYDKAQQALQDFEDDYNNLQNSFKGNVPPLDKTNNTNITNKNGRKIFISVAVLMISLIAVSLYIFKDDISNDSANALPAFNLPMELEHFTDRPEIMQAVWDKLKSNREKRTTTALVGMHGLGGIGKTTLANRIIHYPQKKYQFRAWFSSETEDLLQNDYFDLGTKNHLFNQQMNTKQRISAVKAWLEKQGDILLVYDNVPDMETIKEYLPNKGDIVITSRNYKLPNAIEIDVMSENQAIRLLENLLPAELRKHPKYHDDIRKLIVELGYLPLALSQAGAYIDQNKLNIREYLDLYEKQKNELLRDKTMPVMDNHLPVYVTWDMSIAELSRDESGKEALKLLEFISVCYPENIHKNLMTKFLYGKDDVEARMNLTKLLGLLRNYAIIQLKEDTISVHRLVHAWLKDKHSNMETQRSLQSFLEKLVKDYHVDTLLQLDFKFLKSLSIQLEEYISALKPSSSLDKTQPMTLLGAIYFVLGDYDRSLQVHQKVFQMNSNNSGSDEIHMAYTLHHMGTAYRSLSQHNFGLNELSKALAIKERILGKDHPSVANTLHHMGKSYRNAGEYFLSIDALQKALEIKRRHLSPDDILIADTLHQISAVLLYLGEFDDSMNAIKKAVYIKKKNLPEGHLEIAKSLHQLGIVECVFGKYEQGLLTLHASLQMKEQHLDHNHFEIGRTLQRIGAAYYMQGKYEKALDYSYKALHSKTVGDRKGSMHISGILKQIGMIYLKIGNVEKALSYLKQSLMIREKHLGLDSVRNRGILLELSKVYQKVGRLSESKDFKIRAEQILSRHQFMSKYETNGYFSLSK